MGKETLDFTTEPGSIITTDGSGNRTRHSIAKILRAADIPTGLTHTQVEGVKTLANLMVVLIRTLIDKDVLSGLFLEEEDINLQDMADIIEAIGGDYLDPDLSVTP